MFKGGWVVGFLVYVGWAKSGIFKDAGESSDELFLVVGEETRWVGPIFVFFKFHLVATVPDALDKDVDVDEEVFPRLILILVLGELLNAFTSVWLTLIFLIPPSLSVFVSLLKHLLSQPLQNT